ncbi:hypothetical protein [Nannocystis punicea]|uniref:DUF4168 domain-containing protein n=1 Tax=Nannocystis punicea TaxID=2995304 RepID=A0ABY7HCD6_9BACT|nr:hypothetical protein [Nannocystis poenicansa]WAS96951.1 hypothetical protein O0S08_12445 [Nannocystis poenicansa]
MHHSTHSFLRAGRLVALLGALALALPACGGEGKKTEVTKTTKVETKTTVTKTETPKPEVKAEEPAPKPETAPKPDPGSEKVQVAAAVAKEIAADPEHADDVLAKHGLDRSKLDAMMFEIAADPALTEAYMAARKTT